MAYSQVPNRSSGETIPSEDINQLQDNIEALKGGTGSVAPTTTIEDLATDSGLVKASDTDTDPGSLTDKLVAGSNITLTLVTTGTAGEQEVEIASTASGGNGSIQVLLQGNAYTGTGIIKIRSGARTISKVRLGAGTPPTGSSVTVDVNYHATDPDSATSIFSSLPSIAATAHTGESTSLSTTSIADGGWFVIDIDAVGSTTPGTDITIEII